jgi:hypothetical protein
VNSKCEQIRAAWAAGDKISALRIAAHFFDRSDDTKTFKRGMDAYNNPSFYRQLGKDPDRMMAEALARLAQKFALQTSIAEDQENTGRKM